MISISSCGVRVDTWGPGRRYVIQTQGCTHKCRGCPRRDLWSIVGGTHAKISAIVADIKKHNVNDVTIVGAEPLIQLEQLAELVRMLRLELPKINIWIYTAYTLNEIINILRSNVVVETLLYNVNVIVARLDLPEPTIIETSYHKCKAPHCAYRVQKAEDGSFGFINVTDENMLLPTICG